MGKKINLKDLNEDELKALKQQVLEEEQEKEKRIKEERANYKKMVDQEVAELFPKLKDVSNKLADIKQLVFDSLKTFIELKAELYDTKEQQGSHSFSTKDGTITIIIGYNVQDGWDDTVNSGIEKVNEYIKSLAKDKESKALVETVLKLLSKDQKGNLKASRVLQLRQMADDSGNAEFLDGMKIIQDAYRPTKTKEFVRCLYKGEQGEEMILPLSITDAQLKAAKERDGE